MSSAVHDALWTALRALAKPVDRAAALACAETVLSGKALSGFRDWLDKNEEYLLGRLNG